MEMQIGLCFRRGRVWMFWVGLCVERAGLSAVDRTECWKWVGLGNEGRAVI